MFAQSSPYSNLSRFRLLKGAAAGFLATAPMTATMLIGWRLLPVREKYPLPPQIITDEFAQRLHVSDMDEQARDAAALLMHFSYGAAAGATYTLLERRIPLEAALKGSLAGLALWAGSYLGWLPAMGILTPATRHPLRRNLLMIVAHLIWGAVAGMVFRRLNSNNK